MCTANERAKHSVTIMQLLPMTTVPDEESPLNITFRDRGVKVFKCFLTKDRYESNSKNNHILKSTE